MESILTSVKKALGITEDYEHFDADLIMHINSVLNILTQIGVGPKAGFQIEDKDATWDDFIDDVRLNMVKSYVSMRVKLMFDPPQSSSAAEAMNNICKELEWRLNVTVDPEENNPLKA